MLRARLPGVDELGRIAAALSTWQEDDWPGHLHPGDLGWHSMAGAENTARRLRVWEEAGTAVAVGLADGDVFRMAIDPTAADDSVVADIIADDLTAPAAGVIEPGIAAVEARGARALSTQLRTRGWAEGEPWTPLCSDLAAALIDDEPRGLRVRQAGRDEAAEWITVHWSAFRGGSPTEDERSRLVRRWTAMVTGPFSSSGQHLIGYDARDRAVAVTSVWSAGEGRPGLIEPLAVHREHHGHGYGSTMTAAGALALKAAGASRAVVVAENANAAALATYRRAGFEERPSVADLTRPRVGSNADGEHRT